jgi:5-methylcytosine-specific restriction enzyme A
MLRPCLGVNGQRCGQLTSKSRCPACARVQERQRAQRPTNLTRDTAERRRRAAAVAAHRAQFGDLCPGWGRQGPHPSTDLTADHVVAVAAGGDPHGELEVRCRSCNGRKGDQGGTLHTGHKIH